MSVAPRKESASFSEYYPAGYETRSWTHIFVETRTWYHGGKAPNITVNRHSLDPSGTAAQVGEVARNAMRLVE